jgi:hypothetical protein
VLLLHVEGEELQMTPEEVLPAKPALQVTPRLRRRGVTVVTVDVAVEHRSDDVVFVRAATGKNAG